MTALSTRWICFWPQWPPEDPILSYQDIFQRYQQNNVNLLRVWIGATVGVAWNQYLGGRNIYDGYLPRSALVPFYDPVANRTIMVMHIDYEPEGDTGWFDACRFEFWSDPEAVKQNTTYRLSQVPASISPPRETGFPNYGLGNWGWRRTAMIRAPVWWSPIMARTPGLGIY
jgi:hypothetical protein